MDSQASDNYGVEGRRVFQVGIRRTNGAGSYGEYFKDIGSRIKKPSFRPRRSSFEHKIGEAGSWIVNTVSEMFAEKAWNCPDLNRLVQRGVRGLIADIDEQLENHMILTYEDYRRREFWLGLKEMLLGGIDYAHRYRDLAREMAAKEKINS